MSSLPLLVPRSDPRVVWSTLALSLVAGCNWDTAPAPPAPNAGAAGGYSNTPLPRLTPAGIITREKADVESVLAGLTASGVEARAAKGVEVRVFHFAETIEPLELSVEIEESPAPEGRKGPLTIPLTGAGALKGEGTIRLVILPPESTGKDVAQIVLEAGPGTTGADSSWKVRRDVSRLWYDWPGRRVMPQSAVSAGPLELRQGKSYQLVSYAARDGGSSATCFVTLRCRAGRRGISSSVGGPHAASKP